MKNESIKVIISEDPYTRISNQILKRDDMTMKAKGLICYLLSLPNTWVIHKSELIRHFKDGKDSINVAFNELIELGYISVVETDREGGKFMGKTYTVADFPQRLTSNGKPATVNPQLLNNNIETKYKETINLNVADATVYKSMVEFWLKEFHKDWTFGGMQGKAIKSLINKLKHVLKARGLEISDDKILSSFKHMCINLPDFYKTKDLQVLDSKFNDIIEELTVLKNARTKPTKGQSVFRTN